MQLRVTNKGNVTYDVHRFSFELAGALVIVNVYSGLAVAPAHLYYFRRSQTDMSLMFNLSRRRSVMKSPSSHAFTAYVGNDWADKKHDVCLQQADSETREAVFQY